MRLYQKSLRVALLATLVGGLMALWPTAAAAQRRGPMRSRQVVVVGGYYGPRPYFDSWYRSGPWGPFGPYGPYGPYGTYPYYGRADDLTSSIRLEVTPKTAEVYVNGYRAGIVNNFDGIFQRLRVSPGDHQIVLYQDGYRTVRQSLHLNPGSDQKIRYTMVPLAPGESAGPRPEPPPPPQNAPAEPGARRGGPPQGPDRRMPPPEPNGPEAPNGAIQSSDFGSVSIRVQPTDAAIVIDGERWSTTATADRLVVQLAAGRHHLDVQKDGYQTYSTDVNVRSGETVTLNVSLPHADAGAQAQ